MSHFLSNIPKTRRGPRRFPDRFPQAGGRHLYNLPIREEEEFQTPQVWLGNYLRHSLPNQQGDSVFILPTGGSSVVNTDAEDELSVLVPLDIQMERMIILLGDEDANMPPGVERRFTLRVDGEDTEFNFTIGQGGNSGEQDGTLLVPKDSLLSIKVDTLDFDPALTLNQNASVSLLFKTSKINHFIYAGGSGDESISGESPFLTRRPALNWRSFGINDVFQGTTNVVAWQLSIVSIPGTIRSFRVQCYKTLGSLESGPIEYMLIKGQHGGEQQIASIIFSGEGDEEIELEEHIEAGDILTMAHTELGSGIANPFFYFSLVIESDDFGWFMLGNGMDTHQSVPFYLSWTEGREADDVEVNQHLAPANMEMKNFYVSPALREDDVGGEWVWRSRINSNDGNLLVNQSDGPNAASDVTNEDTIRKGDLIGIKTTPVDDPSAQFGATFCVGARVVE